MVVCFRRLPKSVFFQSLPNLFGCHFCESRSIPSAAGRGAPGAARALARLFLAVALPVCLASCGGGGSSGGSGNSGQADPPPPALTTVTLAPPLASATTSQTISYTAGGTNTTNTNVSWTVDGVANGNAAVGTISAAGVYTPTAAASGEHTVKATSIATPGASASAMVWVTTYPGTFTWRNDAQRSGQNEQELALSPATLNSTNFGKLFSCPVDGEIFAEPLYVANLAISGGTRNVVFVVTENDSAYAFDADASPCVTYWSDVTGTATTLLPANENPVPSPDVNSTELGPTVGITGTPAIDTVTNTIYLVAKSKNPSQLNPTYIQRLHALDITTGHEEPSSPVAILPTAPGNGDGNGGGGTVQLDSLTQNQGAALLLLGHDVYIALGSLTAAAPYHGWVVAYDETTLAQVAVFLDTPNGAAGGIWQGGAGLSVDPDSGYIYGASGSGTFDANSAAKPNNDYGESFIQLNPTPVAGQLTVVGYFTPCNEYTLSSSGTNIGSTGVLPLPYAAGSAAHPRVLLGGNEAGTLYLLDRMNLGSFNGGTCPDTAPLEEMLFPQKPLFGTPAVWTDSTGKIRVYVGANGVSLGAYTISNAILTPTPASQSPSVFSDQAPSPAISSNGATGGIVWALDSAGYDATPPDPAVLHAYDATNLATELYNSNQAGARDLPGIALKFTVPMVGNGKVYVGTETELDVYGFLP
jgi:hypothetical protein